MLICVTITWWQRLKIVQSIKGVGLALLSIDNDSTQNETLKHLMMG